MIAVIIGLGALIVAAASAVLAQLRIRNLERRLEAAIRDSHQRLDTAVSVVTDRIEAWVRSSVDDSHAVQRQTAADWSADLVADIEALFASFRSTVKADTAALVGQALAEYEGRPPTGNGSTRR